MAVTITRSIWIDDDGTGTTGTVINQALHTTLYNEIDTALAKVAQLAGGNTFTGNQTIGGLLNVTGFGSHLLAASGTGFNTMTVANAVAAAGNGAGIYVQTDLINQCQLLALSSTFTANGPYTQAGVVFLGSGAGGLSVLASHAAGALRFYTGGLTERMRIAATGQLLVNTATATSPDLGQISIHADLSAGQCLSLVNTNAAGTGFLAYFLTSANVACGGIQQAGTSVTFNTTSDARLKDDDGRATDLSALRAVVVHDFAWKANGVRDRGVFAQEAHAHYPQAVSPGTDDTTANGSLARPWMTDYSKFVADLIVGWQQHEAELAALRDTLRGLGGPRAADLAGV